MTKLAELLSISAVQLAIPEKNRPSCNKRISARTQPVLRRVLDATCSIRDRVDSLEAVQRELPDDTEINTLLLVTKQIQNDTCHWVCFGTMTLSPNATACVDDIVTSYLVRFFHAHVHAYTVYIICPKWNLSISVSPSLYHTACNRYSQRRFNLFGRESERCLLPVGGIGHFRRC